MSSRVLVVDPDRTTSATLIQHLADAGFSVSYASRGAEALARVMRDPPDAIVTEFSLPDMSGTELCRRLRVHTRLSNLSIVFVSNRHDEIDRVVAFEMGADDYVIKPISGREVALRLRALFRRKSEQIESVSETLVAEDLQLRANDRVALRSGKDLHLTGLEFALLAELIRCRGFVLTRQSLFERIWGGLQGKRSRTVDTHMKRLRAKLGDASDSIETVRGVGYRFRAEDVGDKRHSRVTDRRASDTSA
ncbi:MAG: response regulator transcription factor [Sandaracinaceae bacterium]|nr:response regulator transcription factor [Sandaracinaceae bacterium]